MGLSSCQLSSILASKSLSTIDASNALNLLQIVDVAFSSGVSRRHRHLTWTPGTKLLPYNILWKECIIRHYSNLERLFKLASGRNYDDAMNLFCNFFGDDFCREDLEVQLKTFRQF